MYVQFQYQVHLIIYLQYIRLVTFQVQNYRLKGKLKEKWFPFTDKVCLMS